MARPWLPPCGQQGSSHSSTSILVPEAVAAEHPVYRPDPYLSPQGLQYRLQSELRGSLRDHRVEDRCKNCQARDSRPLFRPPATRRLCHRDPYGWSHALFRAERDLPSKQEWPQSQGSKAFSSNYRGGQSSEHVQCTSPQLTGTTST